MWFSGCFSEGEGIATWLTFKKILYQNSQDAQTHVILLHRDNVVVVD